MGVRALFGASLKPVVILATVLTVGAATAAIALTYSTASTVSTSAIAPPVQFVAGDDAGPSALSDYVTAYSISTNKTYISVTLKGVPEATVVMGSAFKLQNVDDASRTVTLSTSQVSNAYVTAYKIDVYNSANVLQGTLTLTAASPTMSFTLPAGTTYYAKVTLTLASGAGANNVALTNSLSMTVG